MVCTCPHLLIREELEFSEAVYGEVIELFASLINKEALVWSGNI